MDKNDNIFVKLQIEKDRNSGAMMLNIHFDENAPNFSKNKEVISWSPTFEEIDFIVETFEMISKRKSHEHNIKNYDTSLGSNQKTEEHPESQDEKIATFVPLKSNHDTERISSIPRSEKDDSRDKIFVQANGEKIDEVLKRKKEGFDEELIVETDEKTIIDKVLKKKMKNK